MAKVDIKDAYYSVPIKISDQRYLKFEYNGNLYKFTCLPNGLSSGPRKFTKLLKPPMAALRKRKRIVSAYIDDLITIAKTFSLCFDNVTDLVETIDSLGFVVHPDKSEFIPSQVIEYLGFVIDSRSMTVSLTSSKKKKVKDMCISLLSKEKPSIREVARVLGTSVLVLWL